jgi:hypothetical protein
MVTGTEIQVFIKFSYFHHHGLTRLAYFPIVAVVEMCIEMPDQEIIPESATKRGHGGSAVCLSMPAALSEFCWRGVSLKALTRKLLKHVLSISHPARSVRVGVHEKKKFSDLEQFFAISPIYWFQLSIEFQSASGLEAGVQRVLESLGYHCPEWMGVEGSQSQLGAFHFGTQEAPALILCVQNRGARRNCDLLIPVIESDSCLDHAV